jgi:hypothetical protein
MRQKDTAPLSLKLEVKATRQFKIHLRAVDQGNTMVEIVLYDAAKDEEHLLAAVGQDDGHSTLLINQHAVDELGLTLHDDWEP